MKNNGINIWLEFCFALLLERYEWYEEVITYSAKSAAYFAGIQFIY